MYDRLVTFIDESVPIDTLGGNRIMLLCGPLSKKVREYS